MERPLELASPCRNLAITAPPVALWAAWLYDRMSDIGPLGRANFDWPLFAIAEHAGRCVQALAAGDLDSRNLSGLLATVSFAWPSASLLRQWRWALGNVCLLHAVWRFLPEQGAPHPSTDFPSSLETRSLGYNSE